MNEQIDQTTYQYTEKVDPWSSHSILFDWLALFPEGTRVLDVGTAAGILGKKCSKMGFEIYGIEPVTSRVEVATEYYRKVMSVKIEDVPDSFLKDYDVVICADILEHLSDPDVQLRRLVKFQKPETQYLISVPNIANLWVRINLLFGRFEYADKGILDRTHLRFFTRKSFLSVLNNAGLRMVEIKYSPIPLDLVNPYFDRTLLGRFLFGLMNRLSQLMPTLLAYQFVVRATALHEETSH